MQAKLLSVISLSAATWMFSAQAAVDITAGQSSYLRHCQACHQADGNGMPRVFPPLAGNPHVSDPEHIAKTVVHGLSGPLTVNNVDYNSAMPPMAYLSDEEVSNIVAYVMLQWSDAESSLTAEDVAALR